MTATIKKCFKARDGEEFETERAAKAHNDLLDAKADFERAGRTVVRMLAGNAVTADGEPFDLSNSRSYWMVVGGIWNRPQIHEVYLYPYHLTVETDRTNGALVVLDYVDLGQKQQINRYRVSDLYRSKEKAHERIKELWAEKIVQQQEQFAAAYPDYDPEEAKREWQR